MNLTTLRQVWKTPDLRRRVLVVLGLIVIFRFLAHVPVPVPDNAALSNFLTTIFNSNKLLGVADLFSGGALTNFSIVMMGVGPYINASIITQLLTQVIPKMEALSKEGEMGRRRINQITRWLTLPLALVQSIAMVILVQKTSIQVAGTDLIGQPNLSVRLSPRRESATVSRSSSPVALSRGCRHRSVRSARWPPVIPLS